MDCKLIIPTMEYADEIRAYRQEFFDFESSFDGCGSLRRHENPEDWLEMNRLLSSRDTLPEEKYVVSTQFIYVRQSDNKIVGMIQVRHYLNDYLRKIAGHIGYSVRPSERRKGYAKAMLADSLDFCRELGLDKVMVSCADDNVGSRKTILSNGGVYDGTVFDEEDNENIERYWITL